MQDNELTNDQKIEILNLAQHEAEVKSTSWVNVYHEMVEAVTGHPQHQHP